jgi:hypothetical protein
MSKPLYELTGDFKALEKLADDPEMAESVADTMDALEGEFNDKAVALITVSKDMDGNIDKLANEIKRLQDRKKVIENRKEHMLTYLRTNMEASGISKISCPLFVITLMKAKSVVVIDDEEKLPIDYIDISTVRKPMKKELLADLKKLKDDETIAGCHLGLGKAGLKIK